MRVKMNNWKVATCLVAVFGMSFLCQTNSAQAAVIAATSFENETPADQYVDTGDSSVDHDLVNNAGQSPVDSTVASELGYDAAYQNTRGSNGLTDGDFVGVTGFTGDVGDFTDGAQGYQMSDADGLMSLTFDTVVSGGGPLFMGVDFFLNGTGWESDDVVTAILTTNSGTVTLLDTTGSDIDDLDIEDRWMRLTADLTGATSASLAVTLDSNSGGEAVYMDNVIFATTALEASPVPEPTSIALLVAGLIAAVSTRRK